MELELIRKGNSFRVEFLNFYIGVLLVNLLVRGNRATNRRNGVFLTVPMAVYIQITYLTTEIETSLPTILCLHSSCQKTERNITVQNARKQTGCGGVVFYSSTREAETKFCDFEASLVYNVRPLRQTDRKQTPPN